MRYYFQIILVERRHADEFEKEVSRVISEIQQQGYCAEYHFGCTDHMCTATILKYTEK